MNDRTWDDETLSAWLDGEDSVPGGAHPSPTEDARHWWRKPQPRRGLPPEASPSEKNLSDGDRARLEELRAAATAVGGPVPPVDAATREAMIARALDVLDTRPGPVVAGPGAARARRWLDWRWLAPVAAVIAGLVVAVPLLARDRDAATTTAASQLERQAPSTGAPGAADAAASAFSPSTEQAVDLGDTDDQDALLEDVAGAVRGRRSLAGARAGTPSTAASPGSAATGRSTAVAFPPECLDAARAAVGRPVARVYLAVARLRGTPVYALGVVVLGPDGRPADQIFAVVMTQAGCRVLAVEEVVGAAP